MIIFHSDLDNTLIYSYKRELPESKKCVELYQEREVSFMTEHSQGLLKRVREVTEFVPTTTRTVEQYERIMLGDIPRYALTCNGGVLLENGKRDDVWYQESLKLVEGCRNEMEHAIEVLSQDENRSMEIRFIEELFVFTKSSQPEKTISKLREVLDAELVDVYENGVKVYVLPKNLTKGNAVRRLREKLKPQLVIAAGDSEFDVSMLVEADYGYAPESLALLTKETVAENDITTESDKMAGNITEADELSGTKLQYVDNDKIFSEVLLELVLSLAEAENQ